MHINQPTVVQDRRIENGDYSYNTGDKNTFSLNEATFERMIFNTKQQRNETD